MAKRGEREDATKCPTKGPVQSSAAKLLCSRPVALLGYSQVSHATDQERVAYSNGRRSGSYNQCGIHRACVCYNYHSVMLVLRAGPAAAIPSGQSCQNDQTHDSRELVADFATSAPTSSRHCLFVRSHLTPPHLATDSRPEGV